VTAAVVLARARGSGLVLTAHGDRLRWRGPQPPTDLLHDLAHHKAEVLALLAAEAAMNMGDAPTGTASASGSDAPNGWGLTETEHTAALARLQPRAAPADAPDGLQRAALQRPPSRAGQAAVPSRGCFCSCCHGRRWWGDAQGWRCWACHPPDHLAPDEVTEVRS
jgi:hypothetical protein